MSEMSMVFFARGRANLDKAALSLRAANLRVGWNGDALEVSIGDGPRLRVTYAEGTMVRDHARELARGSDWLEQMAPCDARFQIEFEDLDAVLDEIHTLLEVQGRLQELSGGCLYNSWNGTLGIPNRP